jgi:radial spoke head protein 4A
VKRLFTGEVEAEVITNPHFTGKEKDLLRAQIARITQTIDIVPNGYFRIQEDSEREIIDVPEEER